MAWADSATGGGYGGDRGSPGAGTDTGRGGYRDGFGAEVDTGGPANSGASDAGAGKSGYGGMLGSELDATPKGRESGAGRADATVSGRTETRSQALSERERESVYGEIDTPGVANGAIASVSKTVEQAEDEAAKTFGIQPPSIPSDESITPEALDAALTTANFVGMVNDEAKPGMVGTAVNAVASAVPGLGLVSRAINAGLSAQQATKDISTINDNFGTQQDDSFSTSMRSQALGAATGKLGSTVGSGFGASVGSSIAGAAGGVVGALAGGVLGGGFGRTAGVNAATGSSGNTPGEGGGSAGDRLEGAGYGSGSAMPELAGDDGEYHGVVGFDGYASYAAEFFNNLT